MALTDNLVSYYKLDNSLIDSVSSNTLTNSGATYTSSGKINGAYTFTTNDSMSSAATINSAYSISCWFYTNDGTNIQVLFRGTNTPYCAEIMFYNGQIGFTTNSSDSYNYTSISGFSTGTWIHIVVSYNSNNKKMYFNGTKVLDTTDVGTAGTDTGITLGMRPGGTKYFNGGLDEIGIWSRQITDAEVTSLYNSGSGIQYPFSTNQAPTTPTDISISPTTIYANTDVTATASGSTDPESAAFTYVYQFYDLGTSTLLQDYSSDSSYQLTSSNAHHNIRIGAKAHQTSNGSESSAYTENFSVTNTAPSIPTDITPPVSTPTETNLTFTASGSTDTVDNDTLTYYYEFYDTTSAEIIQAYSTDNSITIPSARQGHTIRVRTKSYDGYDYSSEYYEDYLISGVLWNFDYPNNELLIGTVVLFSKPIFKHPTSTVQGCTLVTGNLPEDFEDNVSIYAYTSDGSYLLTSNQLTTFPATHELKLKLVNNSASTYTVPMIDTLGRNIILKIKYS